MKSWFCSIWSSVIPISSSSDKMPRHDGSTASKDEALSRFGLLCAGGAAGAGTLAGGRGGMEGADECR